jgi:hypothetical protein
MLAEALAALASTGSTALVTAMVTDGWEDVRARFARLLGRGDATKTKAAAAQLERSSATLTASTAMGLKKMRAELEIVWRTRLENLLENSPDAEAALRVLLADIQAPLICSAGGIEQHAAAFDQAQQAVQGYGMQNVTFSSQHGSDASRM